MPKPSLSTEALVKSLHNRTLMMGSLRAAQYNVFSGRLFIYQAGSGLWNEL